MCRRYHDLDRLLVATNKQDFEKETLVAADPQVASNGGHDLKPKRRRSLFFLIGSLAGGNLVAMVFRMIGGLITGRLVAPATLGLFNGIGLVLGYVPFLQLGVLNGLNRELPYYVGKGDRQRAEELAAAAQAWALAVGCGVFVALLGVAGWQLAHGEMWKAAGWLANAILALFLFYGTYYLQMTFRTSHDFARLALVNVVESAFGLVLLVLVAFLSFYGLCLRLVLMGIVSTALLYFWRPVRVGPKWSFRHFKHLLKIGVPIFGVGQIYAYWAVIDSTLVLKFAGTEGMGLYAMVILATTALQLVPQAVGQVVYPRMAQEYGKSERLSDLVQIARKPILITSLGLIPVTAIAWLLVRPVMELLLPAYVDAVPAMYWALLLPFISSFQPVNAVFNVARRQDLHAAAVILGMAVYGGSLIWLIRDGVSLAAFPQAMLIGRAMFVVVCYLFIWRLLSRERHTVEA